MGSGPTIALCAGHVRPLLTEDHGQSVRAKLGWLGEVLGTARGADVARARLAELVAAEPADLVVGPVAAHLGSDRGGAHRAAHDQVLAELDGAWDGRSTPRAKPHGGRDRDEHLHEARMAAKRARYAAETVVPAIGKRPERYARAAKDLQTLPGDHHDSVELRAVLRTKSGGRSTRPLTERDY